jgi:hypothetical protein
VEFKERVKYCPLPDINQMTGLSRQDCRSGRRQARTRLSTIDFFTRRVPMTTSRNTVQVQLLNQLGISAVDRVIALWRESGVAYGPCHKTLATAPERPVSQFASDVLITPVSFQPCKTPAHTSDGRRSR